MSILVNKDTKIIVQGLTGKTGGFHTEQALAYHGTQMVAGVHPTKGGTNWTGSHGETLPIYASTENARRTPPLASAGSSLNLPLPRPPAWICDLTT